MKIGDAINSFLERITDNLKAREELRQLERTVTLLTGNPNPDLEKILKLLLVHEMSPSAYSARRLAIYGVGVSSKEGQNQ